ncbi:MAG: NAD(P)H-dependent oxidoreductase [Bifidobacteriaceae bacterium]|jgi:NAD(P)H-dependent FMN reductase|nr:NAD(P)H-dependent oxidoreductase [Bifidobacteriaceae bacterium]
MKLTAIVGTNADFSYNRLLLQFMRKHFWQLADIEILEVSQLPAFTEDFDDLTAAEQTEVWRFKTAVNKSEGVIFSAPEYDHSIPAALKSAIEWLSYKATCLTDTPAMVVGVAYGTQASARAQEHLRQILASPDCSAYVLPGHEVLIGNVGKTFSDGVLSDPASIKNLEDNFVAFAEYATSINSMPSLQENSEMLKKPFISDAYITFPTGKLTLSQAQQIFSTIPFEVDLIDATDHFTWYSDKPNREHVRYVSELGEGVEECHPPKALPIVMKIINSFREGKSDMVQRPLMMHGHRTLIQYYALRDVDGRYLGTIEFTGSVENILRQFEAGAWPTTEEMAETGGVTPDATSGASTGGAPEGAGTAAADNVDDHGEAAANTGVADGPAIPRALAMNVDATSSASAH